MKIKEVNILKGRILIIDDTKNIRLLASKALIAEGYEVDSADSGESGIELFKAKKYELVFVDIRMPYMSGTEVLRIIKDIDENTAVAIITAYPTVKNAVDCIKLGAIDYLRKPFTAEKLIHITNQIIERKNLISSNTNSYESAIEYSKKCINERAFDEAINFLKKAISISIEGAEPFNIMGNVYELKEEYETALKFYNIALQIEPQNEAIVENLKRIKNKYSVDIKKL
jgi:DNA-binding NtrC family response regulator